MKIAFPANETSPSRRHCETHERTLGEVNVCVPKQSRDKKKLHNWEIYSKLLE
jgi:hypothetical protein